MSVAWYLQMLGNGTPDGVALTLAIGGVVAIGLINGFLVAYAEVQAIFVTLASASFVFGLVRSQMIGSDAVPVPADHWLAGLAGARLADVPLGRAGGTAAAGWCVSPGRLPSQIQAFK